MYDCPNIFLKLRPLTLIAHQAATLATSPETSALGSFYTYLTASDDAFSSEKAKEHLSLRFRDVLFKLIPLVGGPQVLSVLMPLAKAEGDVERKSKESKLSYKWCVYTTCALLLLVYRIYLATDSSVVAIGEPTSWTCQRSMSEA